MENIFKNPAWIGLVAFLYLPRGLWAQTPVQLAPTPTFSQAVSLLGEGSASLDEGLLRAAGKVFEPCSNTVTGRFDCCYQSARTCLYLSRFYELQKHRDLAEKLVEAGIKAAQRAVQMEGDSADAHALLARLYETKLSYGDLFTGLDIGPKAGAENKRALALAPDNAQVQLAAGVQYVMAPPIGGGDVKKGIATLKRALELDPEMDEAYYWLAKAYRKQNDRAGFKQSLESALRLNPKNILAQRELESWR